ncbi:hypothetical protein Q8A73_002505 [Channa argus]|nr:hypothetical protein Q8A73_002505 [Channa argus]
MSSQRRLHLNPSWIRKYAAGLDILVNDVVIIMLPAVLTMVLYHSVCARASERGFDAGNHQHFRRSTICHHSKISSSMSARTMVPSLCFGCKPGYINKEDIAAKLNELVFTATLKLPNSVNTLRTD